MIAPDYYEEIGPLTADQMRAITSRVTKVFPGTINPDTGRPYKRRAISHTYHERLRRKANANAKARARRRIQEASRRRNRQRA